MKKLLSFLLVITIVFSTFTFVFASENAIIISTADDADTQVVRLSQFGVAVKELLQLTPGYKAMAETNGDAKILVGYYSETGRLLYTQLADENNEFVVYDDEDIKELRLFALESTDNIKPLSKAYIIK